METKKQSYYQKMKDIKNRYENNEHVLDDEINKMKHFFNNVKINRDKRKEANKEYSKKYMSKMKDIKNRYENNEEVSDDATFDGTFGISSILKFDPSSNNKHSRVEHYFNKMKLCYDRYKKTDDYKDLYKKYYEQSKVERLEKAKIKYNNKTQDEKTKYYYENRDDILNKMRDRYIKHRDFLLYCNKKYYDIKQKEKYNGLYDCSKQILNDVMTLNLGYSM